MISPRQEAQFSEALATPDMLKRAIAWIGEHLKPEEVFSHEDLDQWAEQNGWTLPEED